MQDTIAKRYAKPDVVSVPTFRQRARILGRALLRPLTEAPPEPRRLGVVKILARPERYRWAAPGREPMCISRDETVRLLARFDGMGEGQARLLLDVAGARALRCKGWTIYRRPQ